MSLVLLGLVGFLLAMRQYRTLDDAEKGAVLEVEKAEKAVFGDGQLAVVVLVVVAMFGYVIWTVFHASHVDDKSMSSPSGAGASDPGLPQSRSSNGG
jgi:hypothetical protein